MQEDAYDYSELEEGNGCCLNCYGKYEGCLCFECKCSKCYWYQYPILELGQEKGHCDKVQILIEKNKQAFKEKKERESKIDGKKLKILQEENKKIESQLRKDGKIPNWYSCQVCQKEFVTGEELKIVQYATPLCNICNGKIRVVENEERHN